MDIVKLIHAVKNRPPIWKSTHPQYKNKNINTKLWEEIKELFPEHDVEDLQKRWQHLRDMCRRELKKYPEHNIQSKWRFLEPMSFFVTEFYHNEANTSAVPEAITGEAASDSDTDDQLEVRLPRVGNKTELSPKPESPCHSEDSSSSGTSASVFGVLRKRNLTATELRSTYLQIEEKKLKLLEQELERKENDLKKKSDNYHFFMSILPDVDKLPPIQKMRLRNKINEALLEELKILDREKQSGNEEIKGEQLNTFKNEYCESFNIDE